MQLDSRSPPEVDDFTEDATITGIHIHTRNIELGPRATLAKEGSTANNLKFVASGVECSKGLTVIGPLVAPNWSNNSQYPATPVFTAMTVMGTAEVDILHTTHEVVVPIVKATTGLITPLISGVDAEFTGLVQMNSAHITNGLVLDTQLIAPNVTATTKVNAPIVEATNKVLCKVVNAPVDDSWQEQELIRGDVTVTGPKVTVGGGDFVVNDISHKMPVTRYTHNVIHQTFDPEFQDGLTPPAGWVPDGMTTSRDDTKVMHHTENHGHVWTHDHEGHTHHFTKSGPVADDDLVVQALQFSKRVYTKLQPIGSYWNTGWGMVNDAWDITNTGTDNHELRRRVMQTNIFLKPDNSLEHFDVKVHGSQTVHLSPNELDHDNPDAVVHKEGEALHTALKTARNPRTIIQGEQASFGLHQNEEESADVHLLLSQNSTTEPSFMQVKVDRQYFQCTNKDDDNGAFQVFFKGQNDPLVQGNSGTRVGVNNQGDQGKVYLGRWDRGMPSESNQPPDSEAGFSDVNLAGEIRFSGPPTNFTSGEIVAKLKPTGLELKDVRPLGSLLNFHGEIDFSDSTVTGLPGGAAGYPSLSETYYSLDAAKPIYGSNFGHSAECMTHYNEFAQQKQIAQKLGNGMAVLLYQDGSDTLQYRNYCESHFYEKVEIQHNDNTPLVVKRNHVSEDMSQNYPVATFEAYLVPKVDFGTKKAQFHYPVEMQKNGSSGHFTHCHVMEPDFQNQPWADRVGLAVQSTGYYCARDDSGAEVTNVTNAPGQDYAMVCATLATDRCMGIISSVELVADNVIKHQHGGLTINTPIAEADGHKMLRVCGLGDVFAWVCKPLLSDCPLPYLGGLFDKYVGGVQVGTAHAISDGKTLMLDGRTGVIAGRAHTLGTSGQIDITATDLNVSFTVDQTEQLSAAVLSGYFEKYIDGVLQPTGVVIHCNADMSFSWSESTPSVETRIAALEAAWNEMTGPD